MDDRKKFSQTLVRRMTAHKDAAIDDSWKGGGHPEEIPEVEAELKKTKRSLYDFIMKTYDNLTQQRRLNEA